jgi:hypothetical protein
MTKTLRRFGAMLGYVPADPGLEKGISIFLLDHQKPRPSHTLHVGGLAASGLLDEIPMPHQW